MTNENESAVAQSEQINLKHRITGAGVLIFFCALVLPWLLGPPSEAQKSELNQADVSTQDAKTKLHSTFEDEVLAELEGVNTDFEEPEEKVYVSKITPVSATQSEPQRVDEAAKKTAEKKPKTSDVADNNKSAKTKQSPTQKPTKPTEQLKKKESAVDVVKKEPTKDQAKKPIAKQVAKVEDSKATAKPVANKIEVGLVVQVELLTDKQGAKRLVDELSSKGFKPRTTVVDTNKGKNTGTRIWLGPFESRKLAIAANERLESKMGKPGFIRVYP